MSVGVLEATSVVFVWGEMGVGENSWSLTPHPLWFTLYVDIGSFMLSLTHLTDLFNVIKQLKIFPLWSEALTPPPPTGMTLQLLTLKYENLI